MQVLIHRYHVVRPIQKITASGISMTAIVIIKSKKVEITFT